MKSRWEIKEELLKKGNSPSNKDNTSSQDMKIVESINSQKQVTIESEGIIQKRKSTPAFQNLEKTAISLSNDISLVLALEIDDLPTHKSEFRQGMQRAFLRVLVEATNVDKKVIVFNDAIPAFILMLFKKDSSSFEEPIEWSINEDEETKVSKAANILAKQYFDRTKNKVVTVETEDALFAFFPVSDLKRNLREMGFYL